MIVARLVPTASEGENPYAKVSSGTMKTPPPTPTIDATVPIRNPKNGSRISIIHITSKLFLVRLFPHPYFTS